MRVNTLFLVLAAGLCLATSTAAAQMVPLVGEPVPVPAVPAVPAVSATPMATPKSAVLVKQLVTAMSDVKLDAIAARDPADPSRIIAALAFPDVQLLVISSQYKSAEYLDMQLGKKDFRRVYDTLQQGIPESRIFFHDIGCDGFGTGDNVDILYEGPTQQTMFDGNWVAQSLTESAYLEKRKEAEAKYVHALSVLLEAVRRMSTKP
jgi:hypothetical protein